MADEDDIPIIDGAALSGSAGRQRDAADALVERACQASGFMVIVPPPGGARIEGARRDLLLSVFDLPESIKRRLYRQRFAAGNAHRYRGLAPMSKADGIRTENLDIGPDVVSLDRLGDPRDLLCEASVLPPDEALPGWREEAARTFAGLESLGRHLVMAIERVFDLEPGRLARHFERGNSTLKLVRHPEPGEWDEALCEMLDAGEGGRGDTARPMELVLPHADSGCVTFVSQDEGGGLQARARAGHFVPVPSEPGCLAVNFGQLLEQWTGGAVRATEHRVIGTARRRTSIPFFYEPAVDARIEPVFDSARFEPFAYGDYVWTRMQQFADYDTLGPRFASDPPG